MGIIIWSFPCQLPALKIPSDAFCLCMALNSLCVEWIQGILPGINNTYTLNVREKNCGRKSFAFEKLNGNLRGGSYVLNRKSTIDNKETEENTAEVTAFTKWVFLLKLMLWSRLNPYSNKFLPTWNNDKSRKK